MIEILSWLSQCTDTCGCISKNFFVRRAVYSWGYHCMAIKALLMYSVPMARWLGWLVDTLRWVIQGQVGFALSFEALTAANICNCLNGIGILADGRDRPDFINPQKVWIVYIWMHENFLNSASSVSWTCNHSKNVLWCEDDLQLCEVNIAESGRRRSPMCDSGSTS